MPDTPDQTGPGTIAGNYDSPSADNTKMGSYAQNTLANSNTQSRDGKAQPSPDPLLETEAALAPAPAGTAPTDGTADPAIAPAPTEASSQPNAYGGNFGNEVQGTANDPNRTANVESSINRGAFGEQGTLGNTHGGYGNQFRDFDTAEERPAAEATEEKYYGDGASRPGQQHNSYAGYSGQDSNPAEQGHAVRDTQPAAPTAGASADPASRPTQQDTRNLVSRGGPDAAFQNDNGAPTVGPAYAADYGHTSGAGLPPGTPDNHLPLGPDGHGVGTDPASARGGYDGQQAEAKAAPQGIPAPVDAPTAPEGEGYGYGYQQSEQARPGSPHTGDSRNGFGPGGSKEGDSSQGHGSKGGSYDDENPGARGPAYDNFTHQDKAQNYGQEARQENRPANDEQNKADYGPAPGEK